MMKGFGVEHIDTSGSWDATTRIGSEGSVFVRAYATSGMVANTPYVLHFGPNSINSGGKFNSTALAVSLAGIVGVPEAAVSSGCVGWTQIRGPVDGVQGGNASTTGSMGHAIYWATGVLKCTSDQYIGDYDLGQCGVLAEDLSGGGSTTMNIFLVGDIVYAQ